VPQGIVAFAKDWNEDPTSNHHVLRELAKSRRVLWLNSVATRTPSLSSGRDLKKIVRKLGEFARGPVNVENDLWVFTPLVLPLPHSPVARRINQQILRASIRALRLRLGMDDFHLWTFLPNVADYVGTLGESLSVYYCVDEWSMFSYIDRDRTVGAEHLLLDRVDVVFAINHALADVKRQRNPETHVSPHGVDHHVFRRALEPSTQVPADLAALPGPVIGFYGTIQDWVDLELVAHVARRHPEWSIALIGQILTDTSAVADLPNVHPYRIEERTTFVNPIKLREYLSAGVPVVSTAVPEVMRYGQWCSVAGDRDDFVAAIEAALAGDSPERRAERSRTMESETWQARVAEVARVVDEVAARKARGQRRGPDRPAGRDRKDDETTARITGVKRGTT
jgi:glycosyltransferase involved in cell wall biosynthesis